MLTFKDARTLLLESYLDGVIGDDEFILIYDETFSKSLEFPYEFLFIYLFFYICNNDIKTREYTNNTLNSSSATSMLLMLVSIPLAFFLFSICFSVLSREGFSDLDVPFCQLSNKQLKLSSCFQRPLPISLLLHLCSLMLQ